VLAVETPAVRFVLDESPPLTREEFVDDLVAMATAWL